MNFPQKSQKLSQAMAKKGLNCVGCSAATYETIEAGMLGHGKSDEEIESFLVELNEILNETSDPMAITLTPKAAEKIRQVLIEDGKEGCALRFGMEPGGCSGFEYLLDLSEAPEEGDTIFHSEGVEIHVDAESLPNLIGSEIDYSEGLMGAGFKISNPNAKNSCACGKSQSY